MTTPHSEILAILREHWPEQVPRNYESCALVRWALCFRWKGAEAVTWDIKDHDAHAHIELAAWRAVREWCKNDQGAVFIAENNAGVVISEASNFPDGVRYRVLGSGPDDPSALLAALKHIVAAKGGGR